MVVCGFKAFFKFDSRAGTVLEKSDRENRVNNLKKSKFGQVNFANS